MDQESFRKLLQTPRPVASRASTSRGSLLAAAASASKKAKLIDPSQPAFKPRKVKGADGKYRDRAAERRTGGGNDFAHVEALLEDFEKQHANEEDKGSLDEKRRYLGGNSEHSVLVKGLDYSLLEQNKAKEAQTSATQDDEELEQVFREVETTKKRSRADVLKQLKERRTTDQAGDGSGVEPEQEKEEKKVDPPEAKKKEGKFKPIGFKPIGQADDKAKRKKGKEEGEGKKKKKKRKVEEGKGDETKAETTPAEGMTSTSAPAPAPPPPEHEHEPVDEDFDIFAGAGEYEGLNLGDEDDEDEDDPRENHDAQDHGSKEQSGPPETAPPRKRKGWFDDDEPEAEQEAPLLPALSEVKLAGGSRSPQQAEQKAPEEEDSEEQPMRLQPLASSAVPSIKDILAMDETLEKEQKRRARKEKKKGGGGSGDEGGEKRKKNDKAKVERDYQRLKSYTDKKAGGSTI